MQRCSAAPPARLLQDRLAVKRQRSSSRADGIFRHLPGLHIFTYVSKYSMFAAVCVCSVCSETC